MKMKGRKEKKVEWKMFEFESRQRVGETQKERLFNSCTHSTFFST
jgi:hypothetical protein